MAVRVLRQLLADILQNQAVYFYSFAKDIERVDPLVAQKIETFLPQLVQNRLERRVGNLAFCVRIHVRAGHQPTQPPVAFRRAREHREPPAFRRHNPHRPRAARRVARHPLDRQLHTVDRRQACLRRGFHELHQPIKTVPIQDREPREPQLQRTSNHILRLRSTIQERIGRGGMELRERGTLRAPPRGGIGSLSDGHLDRRGDISRHGRRPRATGQDALHARPRQCLASIEPHAPHDISKTRSNQNFPFVRPGIDKAVRSLLR